MTTKTAIDLQKFCATEDSKYSLSRPFTRGGFTFATNGHIIVRVPALPDIPPIEKAPNPESLPWDAVVTDDQWLRIDYLTFETLDCEDCHGGGLVFKEASVKIRSKSANPRYLKLIQSLPGVLIATDATPKGKAIIFKFDGGCGLLMPMMGDE